MSKYDLLKERLMESPSNEWSSGLLCEAADAIDNLGKRETVALSEQARLMEILSCIAETAAVYERQVGSGHLVENIRYGFERLGGMARQEPKHIESWQPTRPGADRAIRT